MELLPTSKAVSKGSSKTSDATAGSCTISLRGKVGVKNLILEYADKVISEENIEAAHEWTDALKLIITNIGRSLPNSRSGEVDN